MSAFIVNPNCVNKIVTYLNRHGNDCRWLFHGTGYVVDQSADLDKLATDLFHMNCDAVDARYGKGTAAAGTAEYPAFEFEFVTVTPVQAYKSAQCLSYQCSEGDVPERPLYKFLDKIVEHIAHEIVRALPEYDVAKWGE